MCIILYIFFGQISQNSTSTHITKSNTHTRGSYKTGLVIMIPLVCVRVQPGVGCGDREVPGGG